MSRIHVLEPTVAELIAAGEVIERPASIVKELVENAIDAGSTNIIVEIQHGGISFIRVTDNGIGMEKDDIPIAFQRHATSKIASKDDLNAIYTFGFRGEALTSISSVCKVELLSRYKDHDTGARYVIEGGREILLEDAGCPLGTTIIVRDVFFNTPARMKFLKKDSTEAAHISTVLEKLALANPTISFRYIKDGELKLHTPGNSDPMAAIHAVYGKDFSASLIPVDYSSDGVSIKGYITSPRHSKPTRSYQSFFINSRYIQSKTCSVAFEEAYKSSIMIGKFPGCVLNLMISADRIDINVHPSKLEVRFSDDRVIFDAVYLSVKNAIGNENRNSFLSEKQSEANRFNTFQLSDRDYSKSQLQFSVKDAPSVKYSVPQMNNSARSGERGHSAFNSNSRPSYSQLPSNPLKVDQSSSDSDAIVLPKHAETKNKEDYQVISSNPPVTVLNEKEPSTSYTVLGELFRTYIVVSDEENLYLIDKHAAHERFLFERIKSRYAKGFHRQALLEPIVVSLSHEMYDIAKRNVDVFSSLGFSIEDFGEALLIVREVPAEFQVNDVEGCITEIAESLLQNKNDLTPECYDELFHSVACRSAIKANDSNSILELEQIVQIIHENNDLRYCPHGRPIFYKLSKHEIDKSVGRLG